MDDELYVESLVLVGGESEIIVFSGMKYELLNLK